MEQGLPVFLLSVMTISLSGVLIPGPMTASVIEQGGRSRLAGLYVTAGHGIVEIPLILLLALGAGRMLEAQHVRSAIGLIGGIYLLYTAWGLLHASKPHAQSGSISARSSLTSGIFLSLLNPYFLFWWATVGMGLVISALRFGAMGLGLFIVAHLICDVLWYALLGAVSYSGSNALKSSAYGVMRIACGLAMVYFGGVFILGALG